MHKVKNNTLVWFLVVIAFIGALVFISVHNKNNSYTATTQTHMQNTQDVQGVKITILKEGTGEAVKTGDTVAVNYTGKFMDGTAFDSNVDPKFQHVEAFVFTVGEGKVIKGWDVGVVGMKVGEKRNLVIQPDYAYGAGGAGGVIPPNAALIFDVELLAIKK